MCFKVSWNIFVECSIPKYVVLKNSAYGDFSYNVNFVFDYKYVYEFIFVLIYVYI